MMNTPSRSGEDHALRARRRRAPWVFALVLTSATALGAALACSRPELDLGDVPTTPTPTRAPSASAPPVTSNAGGQSFVLGDIIDNMETDVSNLGGFWYAYSDRTCTGSNVLLDGSAGTLLPIEGPVGPSASPRGPGPDSGLVGGPYPYHELYGGGEAKWGAALGMDMTDDAAVNPYTPCIQACGGMGSDGGSASSYDASAHAGIAFYGRLDPDTGGPPLAIDVRFADSHSHPLADGGGCNACVASGAQNGCGNDEYVDVTFDTNWRLFTVFFADTHGDDPALQLDVHQLYAIHFQVSIAHMASPTSPLPTFDLEVAMLRWVDSAP